MENWKRVWRRGIAPLCSTATLRKLEQVLESDSPQLTQGDTVRPYPVIYKSLPINHPSQPCNSAPDAACLIAWIGWQGGEATLTKTKDVAAWFGHATEKIVALVGFDEFCVFLNWFDETPRPDMRHLLLEEVRRSLTAGVTFRSEWNPVPHNPLELDPYTVLEDEHADEPLAVVG